jgi:hypothetical protein
MAWTGPRTQLRSESDNPGIRRVNHVRYVSDMLRASRDRHFEWENVLGLTMNYSRG